MKVEGARLESRAWLEVAAGANAVAVRTPLDEWEVVQFLDAELVGVETYALRRLLRGQAGTDGAMGDPTPARAPVVVLDRGLQRAEVNSAERGLPLLWRAAAATAGAPATDASFTWRALHGRPWSPAHLRAERGADGSVRLSWMRRARIGGDGWEGEPPLSEEREVYQVQVRAGARLVREFEAGEPAVVYAAEQIASDFPGEPAPSVEVAVRQGSGVYGWGVTTRRVLRL